MRCFYFPAIQQAALCSEKHNNELHMLLTIKELFLTFTASLAVSVALHISGESVRRVCNMAL